MAPVAARFSMGRPLPMKALFIACLIGLLAQRALAQPALLHTVAAPGFGNQLRVLPTPDQGWVLFAADSLKLAKFSACGRLEWSYRYRPAAVPLISWAATIIRLRQGGFAFTTRVPVAGANVTLLTCLDDAGQVRWSRTISAPDYNHYPYTLNEDQQGNLVIFANVEHVNLSPGFNLFCSISPAGAVVWSRAYNLGGIWGGAIFTRDGGLLARTGSRFFKTDATGNVQWAVQASGPSDNSYYAPLEVADGFIFNSHSNSREISFYKIDHQGNLRWNGRKRTAFTGQAPQLRPRPNNQFAAVFNQLAGGRNYPTVVEFDAELNVVRQGAITAAGVPLFAADLQLTDAGAPLVIGRTSDAPGNHFFACADTLFHFACDSLLAPPQITLEPATHGPINVTATAFPLTATPQPMVVTAVTVASAPVCTVPRTLDLGPDTTVCLGTRLTLRNRRPDAFDRYRWSTGAATPSLRVQQSGTYWVRAYYNCGLDSLTDTLRVAVPTPPTLPPAADTVLCTNATVTLDARVPGATAYRWQDGSTAPQLVAADTGTYFVDVTAAGCAQRFYFRVTECEQLLMPNIFTVTGDALNERLLPIIIRGIGAASLTVYNRWGRQIYTTDDLRHQGWDGAAAGPGTYFWLVRYTTFRGQHKTAKGWVELM